MLDFLLAILFFIIGIALGFYLLLYGRKGLVVTTAIICLAATGGLLALIFLGESSGWALTEGPDWRLLGITIAAGIVGGILGSRAEHIAASVIGFAAGAYIGLWFYDIAFHIVVDIGHWSEQVAFWVGVAILIISGLVGLYLTRRSEDVAVIMISVFVGADLIIRALGLSSSSSWTAVFTISIALLGLVVQYAQYLREVKGELNHFISDTGAPITELFDLTDD